MAAALQMPPAQSDKIETMDAVDREHAESEVIRDQDGKIGAGHWGALILLAAATVLAPYATARFRFTGFVAAHAIAVAAWFFARRIRLPSRVTIAIAIALRLGVAFHPPLLSADVYRYLFDGRTLASGTNPYSVLPDDPRVNHPEIPTIYPPHAEILFAAVHRLTPWRLLLIAGDAAIVVLLGDDGMAYALFPPAIFEGAWNGHVEIVTALLLLIAWRRRSAVAAAFAAGMKVIPIAAVPAIFAASSRRMRFAIVFAVALLAPAVPFLLTGAFMPGMRDYATRWVFNSPLYDATFFAVDALGVAPHAKALWTSIKDPLHLEFASHFIYFHLYADFLTRALLGVVALLLIARWWRDPVASIGALLLCAPAIHPWYWLVLVPLAMRRPAWLALALCAPASYLLYDGARAWIVFAICYGVPIAIRLSAIVSSGAESRRAATRLRTERDTSPSRSASRSDAAR